MSGSCTDPGRSGRRSVLSLWCPRCETAFSGDAAAWLSGKAAACPRCHALRRVLPWKQIRMFRPEYPVKPEYGRTYPISRPSCR